MPDPARPRPGRPHLQRDNQQWIFDYLVKETGAVYHWWSEGEDKLTGGARSHAMISKQMGRSAQRTEALAGVEEAAGHHETAFGLYYRASQQYMRAQHPIFELNDEKRFLYAGLQRCYDKVCQLGPYPIERVDVPWEDTVVSGYLHLRPGSAKGPLLLQLPGSDNTAEGAVEPAANAAHSRGFHVFTFDGPGQGRSNMRGIRLTPDNYERATSAVIDHLVGRPEIDAERIALHGTGMAGFWGIRAAAHDHRIAATATKSSYAEKYYVLNEDSPRYKQLFAFLTQSTTEDELDAVMAEMTLDGYMEKVACPSLMVVGEYDHRDPLDEVYGLFDQLGPSGELWVFADQFHRTKLAGSGDVVRGLMFDWLADRLQGVPNRNAGEVLYLDGWGMGPNSPDVSRKRRWFEAG